MTWSLQVRALDDLLDQAYAIPASSIGSQSVGLGTRPELSLPAANQTLASGIATSLLVATMPIRYRSTGDSAFPTPAQNYCSRWLLNHNLAWTD